MREDIHMRGRLYMCKGGCTVVREGVQLYGRVAGVRKGIQF